MSDFAHFIERHPSGWLRASLPQIQQNIPDIRSAPDGGFPCPHARKNFINQRWQEVSQVQPEDSRFLLVIPVHNEEYYLQSCLGSVAMSLLPYGDGVTILLVTNGCTDRSESIVREFMEKICVAGSIGEHGSFGKDGNSDAVVGRFWAGSIVHVQAKELGKANAQNIANKFAVQEAIPIVLSLDANNWVEPDSIASLYGAAHREICQNRAVLVGGQKVSKARDGGIVGKMKSSFAAAPNQDSAVPLRTTGWFFGWDASFIESIGGVPLTATEDYALNTVVSMSGKDILPEVPGAHCWGFHSATIRDVFEEHRRFTRGRLQLYQQFLGEGNRRAAEHVHAESEALQPWHVRVASLFKKALRRPERAFFDIGRTLIFEAARLMGMLDYIKDPHKISWTPIASTKNAPKNYRANQ